MPEYLAPGVYVEETSFRAKSIEGVSTSTTAFAGPTRRGPIGDVPELLTSFPDYERIYGGLEDLFGRANYLAHAVRAYFNEGGSRLYVSRAFLANSGTDTGHAQSAALVPGATAADQVRFVARFPGESGNGTISLRQMAAPATVRTMQSAPPGTLVRVGTASPAGPAQLQGGVPPFNLPDGGRLFLTVHGAEQDVTFRGSSAEAVGDTPLADPVVFGADATVPVTLSGQAQSITIPAGSYTPEELADVINPQLRGGYAYVNDDGRLVFGSDRQGSSAGVDVPTSAELGFTAPASVSNAGDAANNNVPDLSRVTAGDINAVLDDAGIDVSAVLAGNQLVLTTEPVDNARLVVRGGANSVHGALGLPVDTEAVGAPGSSYTYYVKGESAWTDSGGTSLTLPSDPNAAPAGGAEFLTLYIVTEDRDRNQNIYEDLGFHPSHPRYVGAVLAENPSRRSAALENPFAIRVGANVTAFQLRRGLFPGVTEPTVTLSGGNDGLPPTQAAFEEAFTQLDKLDDISIVAAPGYSALADAQGIQGALIGHAERRRAYRIAVLDTPPEQVLSEAREVRSRIDSKYAAIYFPWVVVSNPLSRPGVETVPREISLPPSGFVCGIYARNDVERGVHKAPANEVVRSALRFETDINFAEQEVLNPLGINCLRFFPGRGYRVWGARLASSDPEWKYVNVRRYFNYLERSIDQGTQWAVFESNGERLWANVRETVDSFLYNEWRSGALLGTTPKEAYFVRCDRSTMTQNDLDNGRLICLIGVAVLKPAEFVIFRIGQKTADFRG